MWLTIPHDGKKYACDECGQVFKLLRLKGSEERAAAAADHH